MIQTIYFGAGCFWCSEAVFSRLKGVVGVQPGYAGGTTPSPTYDSVSTGTTGHTEVVRVEYDASVIALKTLLSVFFATHDPTTVNRQGYDMGTQYRSAIYYQHKSDRQVIDAYLAYLARERIFASPIVTEVRQIKGFTPAEPEHMRYYDRNMDAVYCQVVISPKVTKLRESFAPYLTSSD